MPNGVNGSQPLSIDTGMNARSMPTTPATTPPSNAQQPMPGYAGQQGYDKNVYSTTPGSQQSYAQHSDTARYGQPPYGKSDMGPPSAPTGSSSLGDAHDQTHGHDHDQGGHPENGYMHTNPAYANSRPPYGYNPGSDHPHLSPEMTGSPHHPGSGHATPRTMPPSQGSWSQDYQTPPRPGTSSNVYNVMGNTSSSNPPSSSGNYGSSAYSGGVPSKKRGREDDDSERTGSRDYDYNTKRQNTGRPDSFGMPLNAPHMQAIKTGGQR